MSDFIQTRTIRARKSYAAKTGQTSRQATILAKAMFGEGPKFHEDENGFLIREWQKEDLLKWTFDELRDALANRVAVESGEVLGTVPPSAIKYCVTKLWLRAHGNAGLYFVTAKAARELDLPVRFRGAQHHGRRIRFAA